MPIVTGYLIPTPDLTHVPMETFQDLLANVEAVVADLTISERKQIVGFLFRAMNGFHWLDRRKRVVEHIADAIEATYEDHYADPWDVFTIVCNQNAERYPPAPWQRRITV